MELLFLYQLLDTQVVGVTGVEPAATDKNIVALLVWSTS